MSDTPDTAPSGEKKPFQLVRKTHEELVQLAQDIMDNKIYSNLDLPESDPNALRSCFMLLGLLPQETLQEFMDHKVSFFYEYLAEAGPRMVNGRPSFMSFRYLGLDDFQLLRPMVLSLLEARRTAIAALSPQPTQPTTPNAEHSPQAV